MTWQRYSKSIWKLFITWGNIIVTPHFEVSIQFPRLSEKIDFSSWITVGILLAEEYEHDCSVTPNNYPVQPQLLLLDGQLVLRGQGVQSILLLSPSLKSTVSTHSLVQLEQKIWLTLQISSSIPWSSFPVSNSCHPLCFNAAWKTSAFFSLPSFKFPPIKTKRKLWEETHQESSLYLFHRLSLLSIGEKRPGLQKLASEFKVLPSSRRDGSFLR